MKRCARRERSVCDGPQAVDMMKFKFKFKIAKLAEFNICQNSGPETPSHLFIEIVRTSTQYYHSDVVRGRRTL